MSFDLLMIVNCLKSSDCLFLSLEFSLSYLTVSLVVNSVSSSMPRDKNSSLESLHNCYLQIKYSCERETWKKFTKCFFFGNYKNMR